MACFITGQVCHHTFYGADGVLTDAFVFCSSGQPGSGYFALLQDASSQSAGDPVACGAGRLWVPTGSDYHAVASASGGVYSVNTDIVGAEGVIFGALLTAGVLIWSAKRIYRMFSPSVEAHD